MNKAIIISINNHPPPKGEGREHFDILAPLHNIYGRSQIRNIKRKLWIRDSGSHFFYLRSIVNFMQRAPCAPPSKMLGSCPHPLPRFTPIKLHILRYVIDTQFSWKGITYENGRTSRCTKTYLHTSEQGNENLWLNQIRHAEFLYLLCQLIRSVFSVIRIIYDYCPKMRPIRVLYFMDNYVNAWC